MPFNAKGAVELPLEVIGSWCTEMAPPDLPKGVSPDNQEMWFVPGNAGTRPALQRVLSPLPAGGPNNYVPTVVYSKSFKTPTGVIKSLIFDSNGSLWVKNGAIDSAGAPTLLFQSTPGSLFRSTTAFGREYLCASDGLHGTD